MRAFLFALIAMAVLIVSALPSAAAHGAAAGLSACAFPQPPAIPDGRIASDHELAAAGEAVRAFVVAMQGSLDCIDSMADALPEPADPLERGSLTVLYNNGVDQMHAIADAYNVQVERHRLDACASRVDAGRCETYHPQTPAGAYQGYGHH